MNICDNLIDLCDWNDIINNVRNEYECKNNPLQSNKNIKVINIRLDELRERINELNEFKQTGNVLNTMCAVGKRAYAAARFLKQNGINAKLCSAYHK